MVDPESKDYKRITEELKKLQVFPLDLGFDFGGHADKFRNLPEAVVMKAQSVRGREEWICGPDSHDNLNQSGPNYGDLVLMATIACGYPNNQDGIHAWHMLLERDSSFCNGSYLTDPREASARYCEHLDHECYALKRQQALNNSSGGSSRNMDNAKPKAQSKPTTCDEKRRRGRPESKDVKKRIHNLRKAKIFSASDLSDSKKIRNAFAYMETDKLDVPGYLGDTDWMSLLNDPKRESAFNSVIEALRKNISRA